MRDVTHASFTTRRLVLEPLRLEHAELCIDCLRDIELYTYVPQMPPIDVHELEIRYKEILRGSGSPEEIWMNWFGRLTSSDHYVCFVQATLNLPHRSAYLAYQTFWPFRRKGFAKEACRAVIGRLTSMFGTKLIRAEMDSRNLASRRLVESLNFCQVAIKEKADFFKGADSDEYLYELNISESSSHADV